MFDVKTSLLLNCFVEKLCVQNFYKENDQIFQFTKLCVLRLTFALYLCFSAFSAFDLSSLPQVQLMVDEYKAASLAASRLCEQISELLLVHVDGKMVYGDLEFQEDQQSHQRSQLLRLQNAHQDIIKIMARVYGTFHLDGPEVGLSVCCVLGSFLLFEIVI